MITKKVISKLDQTLGTNIGKYYLIKGEVAEIEFKNQEQIDSYVSLGVIEIAPVDVEVKKEIPVILRDENNEPIPLSSGLEK